MREHKLNLFDDSKFYQHYIERINWETEARECKSYFTINVTQIKTKITQTTKNPHINASNNPFIAHPIKIYTHILISLLILITKFGDVWVNNGNRFWTNASLINTS